MYKSANVLFNFFLLSKELDQVPNPTIVEKKQRKKKLAKTPILSESERETSGEEEAELEEAWKNKNRCANSQSILEPAQSQREPVQSQRKLRSRTKI